MLPFMLINSGQLQAMLGGTNFAQKQSLHPIPHNDCVVDGVGVDGNVPCKSWGWYWDGPSPHSVHYGETVGTWNDNTPFQPAPYGAGPLEN
mmetsp:Transcript_77168/g.113010  ORF Transcript_77168/g.113010 Transcript_77168/m.113010 type:complete len:91 (+) Transcript_77168:33-305(+)|eukprot:CAMPEP_0179435542 /NCGR_PEP_ID=MMETSP0799-20121207/19629_1 /TAXON_ID=46947 /ORGANISM="Geminigera cryophila, Strain CCMP2564" /LENGTH=90 /DNA_ID=CAMNT_0021214971 /DNA_START=8 /DNA_END=280 /DNA_ORIENTATION=-